MADSSYPLGERPGSGLVSRRAMVADIETLAELGARTFAHAFGPQNDPEDIAAYVAKWFSPVRIEAELLEPESVFLLGYDSSAGDGRPVGYCRIRGGSTAEGIAGPAPVELQRLYVEAGHRNAGYGSALMWDCLDLVRREGYGTIWLGVWEESPGALRFYRRWGFEVVGRHDFMLGSARQTDYLMVRSLESG